MTLENVNISTLYKRFWCTEHNVLLFYTTQRWKQHLVVQYAYCFCLIFDQYLCKKLNVFKPIIQFCLLKTPIVKCWKQIFFFFSRFQCFFFFFTSLILFVTHQSRFFVGTVYHFCITPNCKNHVPTLPDVFKRIIFI